MSLHSGIAESSDHAEERRAKSSVKARFWVFGGQDTLIRWVPLSI